MGPHNIVNSAIANGLDIIAITDHNSCENVQAVIDFARNKRLIVLPGMEVYTREGAHIICLFESLEADRAFQEIVYDHLAAGTNDPEWFGGQYIVDSDENIIGNCARLLGMPTNLHAQVVLNVVSDLGGICYPAHIDRQANSLLRVFGFIPNDWPLHAVEIARPFEIAAQEYRFLKNTHYSIIRSSDSHFIEQMGEASTLFKLEQPTFNEISLAIKKRDGRKSIPSSKQFNKSPAESSILEP